MRIYLSQVGDSLKKIAKQYDLSTQQLLTLNSDNSVVRLTGPANPTLTTVALAIRTADYIIDCLMS